MLNRKTILMIGLALSLNACAAADKFATDLRAVFTGDSDRTGKVVYVDNNNSGDVVGMDGNLLPMSPAQNDLASYSQLASQYSRDSSVELFSLDQPGHSLNNRSPNDSVTSFSMDRGAYNPVQAGKISSTDPSVTVFPFSDDMFTAGVRHNPRAGSPRGPAMGYDGPGALTPEMHEINAGGPYYGMEDVGMFTGNPNTIYFEHGSAALNATARQVIASAARNYGGSVHVAAHASQRAQTSDPIERDILNFQMSMKRAMAVTKQLIRDGVPAEAIKTTAYGDARPAVPETDRQAEAKNRRVQILTGAR